ncbi:MAG TPA: anhydro-N-acetylmuramic acid kinase [Candidatus Baltobacteraceae bacterium]|nr:anhydro-N-acetylmuramic acid kinase [Candidatus Baltobacteraceae bacterium]
MIAIGLMSGTSLDGVDAVLVRIRPRKRTYAVDVLNFVTVPFEETLLQRIRAALPPNGGTVAEVAELHHDIGVAFAQAARLAESDMPIDYIASHGQTMWHAGDRHITLQIGDPFVIREAAQSTVCYDFRSADCAAGGHGAPLVPYVDALLLASDEEDRVAVNIGGIANLTVIPKGAGPYDVTAFDSGPGNMLIDAFVRSRTGGEMTFDRDGRLAAAGTVHRTALDSMLADSYFALEPPKSTGRERFGAQFLAEHAAQLDALSLEDGAATLTALTAHTLAPAIAANAPAGAHVLVSGGGVHNHTLMAALQERLPQLRVERSDVMDVHGDAKEAIAFALLGYETLRGRAANVPRVTGARRPVPLGSIAPYDLLSLLAKVEAECRR